MSVEVDCSLSNFLRVSNVECSRVLELIMSVFTFLDGLVDLLTSKWDLTSDCVLSSDNILTETVEYFLVLSEGDLVK